MQQTDDLFSRGPCILVSWAPRQASLDFIFACVRAQSLQSCLTLCDPMGCSPPGSSVHGDSLGKNAGVGCYFLLRWIFLTQGLNPRFLHLLHCRSVLSPLSHLESQISFLYLSKLPAMSRYWDLHCTDWQMQLRELTWLSEVSRWQSWVQFQSMLYCSWSFSRGSYSEMKLSTLRYVSQNGTWALEGVAVRVRRNDILMRKDTEQDRIWKASSQNAH